MLASDLLPIQIPGVHLYPRLPDKGSVQRDAGLTWAPGSYQEIAGSPDG